MLRHVGLPCDSRPTRAVPRLEAGDDPQAVRISAARPLGAGRPGVSSRRTLEDRPDARTAWLQELGDAGIAALDRGPPAGAAARRPPRGGLRSFDLSCPRSRGLPDSRGQGTSNPCGPRRPPAPTTIPAETPHDASYCDSGNQGLSGDGRSSAWHGSSSSWRWSTSTRGRIRLRPGGGSWSWASATATGSAT